MFARGYHRFDPIIRSQHKDGSSKWVRCLGLTIRDDDGNLQEASDRAIDAGTYYCFCRLGNDASELCSKQKP